MIDQQKAKQLETITKWNGKVNACIYCGSVPEIFYVATGHDHTDFDIQWCPCRGSSKTEGELQREQIKQLTAERDRLSALCDKWNFECDDMREDNKRLAVKLYELQEALGEARDSMQFVDDRLMTTDLSGVLVNAISKIDGVLE